MPVSGSLLGVGSRRSFPRIHNKSDRTAPDRRAGRRLSPAADRARIGPGMNPRDGVALTTRRGKGKNEGGRSTGGTDRRWRSGLLRRMRLRSSHARGSPPGRRKTSSSIGQGRDTREQDEGPNPDSDGSAGIVQRWVARGLRPAAPDGVTCRPVTCNPSQRPPETVPVPIPWTGPPGPGRPGCLPPAGFRASHGLTYAMPTTIQNSAEESTLECM